MNFNLFITVFLGFFMMGASVGYVLGFYLGVNSGNIFLFYLSILFLVVGIFLLIYGSFYKMKKND